MAHYQWHGETLTLHCHIQPGAKRSEAAGLHGDRMKIKLKAPPVDGKANAQLISFMAEAFAVPKSHVEISRGTASRQKTLRIKAPQKLPDVFGITDSN
ncbi:DUF167 domain-containing protein [Gilvimarinus sp. F26214L]|uniref:DUF167 domain-containing protein n=1 Tax=Gilvimarinus sp. DZF01 TaxID=3461371 RepID=UPI0040467B68